MPCLMCPLIRFETRWPSSGRLSLGCWKLPIVLEVVLHKYAEATDYCGPADLQRRLAYFQEGRAQATLKALKSRSRLECLCRARWGLEDGTGAELVRGDFVKLSLGGVVRPMCI
jgi:hypothetical protein